MQAAGHEAQHGLGLQGAAAGHEAQPLQRRALAQRLEELGVGAEVGLLQPAERGQRESCVLLLPDNAMVRSEGGFLVQGPQAQWGPAFPSKQAGPETRLQPQLWGHCHVLAGVMLFSPGTLRVSPCPAKQI